MADVLVERGHIVLAEDRWQHLDRAEFPGSLDIYSTLTLAIKQNG
jgi:hypothetical protein